MIEGNKTKIVVILGPTASGKSSVAVALAKWLNEPASHASRSLRGISGGEIISADSRQVYKGLDIGTGKITKKEMKGIKHHLIDVCSPQKRFTASDFVSCTNKTIVKIVHENKVPIICGGTGFYIDALLGDKQIPEVPPNLKLRKQLDKKSAAELFEMLKKIDHERSVTIDRYNSRRLIRAIEIVKAIGKTPKYEVRDKKYDVLKIGIAPITPSPTPSPYIKGKGQEKQQFSSSGGTISCWPNEASAKFGCKRGNLGVSYFLNERELKSRINKRIDKWFKLGLLKEVQNLHKKGLSWKRMSEIGLEYKLVAQYYNTQNMSKSVFDIFTLKEKMRRETWRYAKRQMTWFKKTPNVIWFTPSKVEGLPPKIDLIEKEVKKFLKSDFAKASS